MTDYETELQTIKEMIISSQDPNTILQEIVNHLHKRFEKYNWIGIYLIKNKSLVLGPWTGETATEHVNISIGEGICGSAAQSGRTEIVQDVSKDPRYLACFLSTKSEIVVPIKKNDKVLGEIDIDSDRYDAFDNNDAVFLEKIADMISGILV